MATPSLSLSPSKGRYEPVGTAEDAYNDDSAGGPSPPDASLPEARVIHNEAAARSIPGLNATEDKFLDQYGLRIAEKNPGRLLGIFDFDVPGRPGATPESEGWLIFLFFAFVVTFFSIWELAMAWGAIPPVPILLSVALCLVWQRLGQFRESQHVAVMERGILYFVESHPTWYGRSGQEWRFIPYETIGYAKMKEATGRVVFCCVAETAHCNILYSSRRATLLEIHGLIQARLFHQTIRRVAPHVELIEGNDIHLLAENIELVEAGAAGDQAK